MIQTRIIEALEDGPATSGDIAAEIGRSVAYCSAALHKLWDAGGIRRTAHKIARNRGPGAYLYYLPEHAEGVRGLVA